MRLFANTYSTLSAQYKVIETRIAKFQENAKRFFYDLIGRIEVWRHLTNFSLTNIQHEIVNAINHGGLNQIEPFGNILLDKLLAPQGYSLFVDEYRESIVLLRHYNHRQYPCGDTLIVKTIFDILTLIQSLSEDNSTFSINPSYGCNRLLYSEADDLRSLKDNTLYKINDSQILTLEENEWKIKAGNENIYRQCFIFKDEIYKQLKHCLDSLIYPTDRLEKYIEHNYQSQQEYDINISHKLGRKANGIALLVGLGSIFVSIIINYCSNNPHKIEIIDEQFDSIMNKKERIRLIRDTIILHQPDTVRCVIIEDKTRQNIKNK